MNPCCRFASTWTATAVELLLLQSLLQSVPLGDTDWTPSATSRVSATEEFSATRRRADVQTSVKQVGRGLSATRCPVCTVGYLRCDNIEISQNCRTLNNWSHFLGIAFINIITCGRYETDRRHGLNQPITPKIPKSSTWTSTPWRVFNENF